MSDPRTIAVAIADRVERIEAHLAIQQLADMSGNR